MNYEECIQAVEQFEQQHPTVMMSKYVQGVQIVGADNGYVLELLVERKVDPSSLSSDELMPTSHAYTFAGQTKVLSTRVTEAEMPRSQVRAGAEAIYDLRSGYGTAGWNLYLPLQNVWVCMSNWHVLVDPEDPDPSGNYVYLDRQLRGRLHAFVLNETWDYALARYNNATDAEEDMRACADATQQPYPQELADDISIGKEYWKVGARAPICRRGNLRGVGTRKVRYNNGAIREFRGQLIFEKMTDGGDSGAVIVRASDNKVTGLNFGGNDSETIANPLFKIGWSYLGTIKLKNGGQVPVYDESESVVPTFRSASASPEAFGTLRRTSYAGGTAYPTEYLLRQESNKQLQLGGKLFLGEAIEKVPDGLRSEWVKPVPPPIRDVPVEKILIESRRESRDGGRGWNIKRYLCFG